MQLKHDANCALVYMKVADWKYKCYDPKGQSLPQGKLHLGLYAPLLGKNVRPSKIWFYVDQYDWDWFQIQLLALLFEFSIHAIELS